MPGWIFAVIGGLMILFGAYRVRLGFRSAAQDAHAKKQGGLYAARRTHSLVGVIYVLVGLYLLLGAFGIRLWPSLGGRTPAPATAPK